MTRFILNQRHGPRIQAIQTVVAGLLCGCIAGCSHSIPAAPKALSADEIRAVVRSQVQEQPTTAGAARTSHVRGVPSGLYVGVLFDAQAFNQTDIRRAAWDLAQSDQVGKFFRVLDEDGRSIATLPAVVDSKDYVGGLWPTSVNWDRGQVGPPSVLVDIDGHEYFMQTFIVRVAERDRKRVRQVCVTDELMSLPAFHGKWTATCAEVSNGCGCAMQDPKQASDKELVSMAPTRQPQDAKQRRAFEELQRRAHAWPAQISLTDLSVMYSRQFKDAQSRGELFQPLRQQADGTYLLVMNVPDAYATQHVIHANLVDQGKRVVSTTALWSNYFSEGHSTRSSHVEFLIPESDVDRILTGASIELVEVTSTSTNPLFSFPVGNIDHTR